MKKILQKMGQLLDKKQKRFMILLLFMMLIGAILEAFSVAVIVPVISIVIDSNAIQENELVNTLFRISGLQSEKVFAVAIMVLLIVAFTLLV